MNPDPDVRIHTPSSPRIRADGFKSAIDSTVVSANHSAFLFDSLADCMWPIHSDSGKETGGVGLYCDPSVDFHFVDLVQFPDLVLDLFCIHCAIYWLL